MADTDNRHAAEGRKYPQIVAYLRDTPWAVRESTLAAIMEMVDVRSSGYRFTDEEIEARIGAGPSPGRGMWRPGRSRCCRCTG
jgi:hypothetical protein